MTAFPATLPPVQAAEAVVIGASAGAIGALSRILPALPADYRLPVLVVVHVPAHRSDIAPLFRSRCRIAVKEAEDKEPILSGTVYFAPPGYHLLAERNRNIALSVDEPVLFSRPSIDVLFETAAEAWGAALVGVVLTGANADGAAGLRAITAAGGAALVEDPDGAFAPAMPTAALRSSRGARRLTLDEIATCLVGLGAP